MPLDDGDWEVWDASGANTKDLPSRWSVQGSTVNQSSNIWQGTSSRRRDPTIRRNGTLRIYRGADELTDGEIDFQVNASDDDSIGMAFRLVDSEHYYLFAMDRQRRFHVLARCNGDDYQILAQNDKAYGMGRWYQVRIVLQGPRISVFVDGKQDLQAVDSTMTKGSVALYSYGSMGVKFRNISLKQTR